MAKCVVSEVAVQPVGNALLFAVRKPGSDRKNDVCIKAELLFGNRVFRVFNRWHQASGWVELC